MVDLPGIILESGQLRARVVGNQERLIHQRDSLSTGMNGLASLLHRGQNKNIYSAGGLNYECGRTIPARGRLAGDGLAPRHAPMTLERTGEHSARLTQRAAETAGLNAAIGFTLGEERIDQTIALWPDVDCEGFDTFWASYMNQPQCTSLFMRNRLSGDQDFRWYEAASPGHGNDARVYYRPFDPAGKAWHEHQRDQPLLRQKRVADEASIAATLAAGFRLDERYSMKCPFAGFYYALVDEFVYLMIFREPEFYFWLSPSGGATTRNPAWDYGIRGGALRGGERREFHLRLVYKPFAGVDDVLAEVAAFRGADAAPICGEVPIRAAGAR